MQNIHVSRYRDTEHGYEGTVEPDDRSWILFLPKDGLPELFLEAEAVDEDGLTVRGYVPALELVDAGQ